MVFALISPDVCARAEPGISPTLFICTAVPRRVISVAHSESTVMISSAPVLFARRDTVSAVSSPVCAGVPGEAA